MTKQRITLTSLLLIGVSFLSLPYLEGASPIYEAYTTDFYLESECATVGSNFNIITDASASNGAYITSDLRSTGAVPMGINDRVSFHC